MLRSIRIALLTIVALGLLYAGTMELLKKNDAAFLALSLTFVPACLLAQLCCFATSLRSHPFARKFWFLLGTTFSLVLFSSMVHVYFEQIRHTEMPSPSLYDVAGWFWVLPLALALFLTHDPDPIGMDWQRLLDSIQIGIILTVYYLYFIYLLPYSALSSEQVNSLQFTYINARNALLVSGFILRGAIDRYADSRSLFRRVGGLIIVFAALQGLLIHELKLGGPEQALWYSTSTVVITLLVAGLAVRWNEPSPPQFTNELELSALQVTVRSALPTLAPWLVLVISLQVMKTQPLLARIVVLLSFGVYSLRLIITQYRQRAAVHTLKSTEAYFRLLFASNPQAMWVYDRETLRFLDVNQAAIRHYGYSRAEFLAMKATEIRPPDEVERFLAANRTIKQGAKSLGQWRHCLKDGKIIDVETSAQSIEFGARENAELVVVHDVTENVKTEKLQTTLYRIAAQTFMAQDLNQLYQGLQAIIGEMMYAKNFYIALYDEASQRLRFPWYVDEHDPVPSPRPLGKGLTEYVLRTGKPLLATPDVFRQLVDAGEVEFIGADSYDWLGVPLAHNSQTIGVLVVQSYDTNHRYSEKDKEVLSFVSQQVAQAIERKHAEEAMRESESKFRAVAETAPSAIYIVEALKVPHFIYVNEACEALTGFSREELLQMSALDILHPESRSMMDEFVTRRASGEPGSFHYEARIRTKSGELRWGDFTSSMIQFQGAPATLGIGLDVTERKRAEQEVREAESRYRALVEQLNAITYISPLGMHAKWQFVSPQVEPLLGYTQQEWLAHSDLWFQHVHVEDQPLVEAAEQATLHGEPFQAIYRYFRRDGRMIWINDQGVLVRSSDNESPLLHGLMIDITDRKQLEAQLQQSQKMEAVGTLAGGVAHDFNNLLTVIKGYSRLLIEQAEGQDQLVREAAEIEKAADRAASLTSQLLAFSRQQMVQPKVLSLNNVVTGVEKMLRRVIGEDIELVTRLDPALDSIKADPGQMEQVLMNLAVNARDAMPHGGSLIFETANVHLDAAYVRENLGARPGAYVMLSVNDSGTGMDKQIKSRIFEPFFTTKEAGRGTGLGLSMVYGIVKQSEGYITVESELGRGTRFKLYLPRVDKAASPVEGEHQASQKMQGTETVLLVEDDDALRRLAHTILNKLGYQVLVASRTAEAEQLCRNHPGTIHLLLTDLVMPGGSGWELAERLSPTRPDMRVLYMSGYAEKGITQGRVIDPNVLFLPKPFSPAVLASKVREALQSKPAATKTSS